MSRSNHQCGWVIVVSFLLTLLLTIVPLSETFAPARPQFAVLCLIYWNMALPQRVGVGVGWTLGLFVDVITGGLLGMHAFSFAVVSFLTLKLYQRVRVFPLWQQALTVLVLTGMNQMLILWVRGIIGTQPQSWSYWLASLTSMAIWPLVFIFMRRVRRRFQVR
jgi:rod shape-determining protein MreD